MPSSVRSIVLLVAVALHAAECHSGKLKRNWHGACIKRGNVSVLLLSLSGSFLCILFCWPDVVRIYVTPQKKNSSPLRSRCHDCVISVQICMRPMSVLVPPVFRCPEKYLTVSAIDSYKQASVKLSHDNTAVNMNSF